jgi:hypothetical protein
MPDHEKSITGSNYCGGCGQDWPCEYEQLRAENERLQAMVTQLTRERDSLRRTLGEMIGVHLPGIAASEEVCRNLPVKSATPCVRSWVGSPDLLSVEDNQDFLKH